MSQLGGQGKLLAFLFVSVLIVFTAIPIEASSGSAPLKDVTLWADLLGANQVDLKQSGQWSNLTQFQLLVVDADTTGGNFTEEAIAELKSGGTRVLSYLNLGACENNRWYWSRECEMHILAPYENYPGEFWMNVSSPSWKKAVVEQIAAPLFAKGIDGFYLDNLDIVEVFPEIDGLAEGLHTIVTGLRTQYPDALLVAQNGLAALNDTSVDGLPLWSRFHALAHEDVFATYDFEAGRYVPQVPERTSELVAQLRYYQERGLKIFTVDFADTADLAHMAVDASVAHKFTPYVGPIDLDRVVFWAYYKIIPEFPSGPIIALTSALLVVLLAMYARARLFSEHLGRRLSSHYSL